MILPIVAIGDPILRIKAADVTPNVQGLQELIDSMFETMYNANGVGLAAPQVGRSIRLFVLDTNSSSDDAKKKGRKGVKEVFINPEIEEFYGDDVEFEEGCLSIPALLGDVMRPEGAVVHYLDRNFEKKSMEIDGLLSRVFQHEFDHLDGVLFIDHLPNLKKRMMKTKIDKIKKGKVDTDYPMRFAK